MTAGQILGPGVISVIGCGGKTTFIQSLAQEMCQYKVLISPTTKIYPMKELGENCVDSLEGCLRHQSKAGIQCLGLACGEKLSALPTNLLAKLVEDYDLTLLEADGSRGLPCKGWSAQEPVIPNFTTHTVGIVTLQGINRPVSQKTVLRIPEFTAITGLGPGEIITERALAQMVRAMFCKAVGQRFLFVNDPAGGPWLKQYFSREFTGMAWGSALENTWNEV